MKTALVLASLMVTAMAVAPSVTAEMDTAEVSAQGALDTKGCSLTPPGAFVDCYVPYLISYGKGRVSYVCDQISWDCEEDIRVN